LQRLRGSARVCFAGRENRLTDLYQTNPCRVFLPRRPGGKVEAILLNTAGGITDGDELDYAVCTADGAHVVVTTQAAEKIYRSRGDDCLVRNQLQVINGAFLEWLPQETILFDGAVLTRKIDIRVDTDSRLLAMDWLILGRLARGEHLRQAAIHDQWRLRRDSQLIWADDFRLNGDVEALCHRRSLLDGAHAIATIIYVAPDAPDLLETARRALRKAVCRAGVSERTGQLICRFLGPDDISLRRDVEAFLATFRAALYGHPAPLPRVWAC
tara:strand:- start:1288 stop:2097 length:810 start_codon:yes stop_codon:yes gene_type:complete